MDSQNNPCPQCGSVAVKRIVWTEESAKIETSDDPAISYLNGPSSWNESSGPDLICSVCEKRFWSDPLQLEEYEAETRRQRGRIAAMKRGEYMLFDPHTTSVDEIAHAVWQQIQRSKKAGAKAARAQKNGAKKDGEQKNGAD